MASAAGYDAGELWEAKRLATAVYTIVADQGSNSRSILRQLGIKNKLEFLSCVQPPDEPGRQTLAIIKGMCGVVDTIEGPLYYPVLGNAFFKRHIAFNEWWDEVLFTNKNGQDITRKNLTFSLRSKDGGSHFDSKLPETAYLSMKLGSDTGLIALKGDGPQFSFEDADPIRFGHLALMRQVTYELIDTLDRHSESSVGDI